MDDLIAEVLSLATASRPQPGTPAIVMWPHGKLTEVAACYLSRYHPLVVIAAAEAGSVEAALVELRGYLLERVHGQVDRLTSVLARLEPPEDPPSDPSALVAVEP